MNVYFDNAATTRPLDAVRELMIELMDADYGNPSSLHLKGVDAEEHIKTAAKDIASILKCKEKELIFTSGGTESNNLALIGGALAKRRAGKHIISTEIEHASVHSPLDFLKKEGYEITLIGTDEHGIVDVEALENAIREDTILVSCMLVNNEIGSVQPCGRIAEIIRKKKPDIYFHIDAVQAFGKIPVLPKQLGCDLLSVSGHKIHGPKGSGFLYVKEKTLLRPIIYGGGQQHDMRSGTENVPAICGMGLAAKTICSDLASRAEHLSALKNRLREGLTAFENVYDNSGDAPHIASFSFVGVRSEVMLHALEDKGIYVSAGSACSSNKPHVSNVLKSIALPKDRLESTLRFSFGTYNTEEEVDYVIETIGQLLPVLRKYTR